MINKLFTDFARVVCPQSTRAHPYLSVVRRCARRLQRLGCGAVLTTLCLSTLHSKAHATPTSSESPRFLGVSSCASSHCHGSAKPRSSTSVLQNEFFIWYKHDAHSKAYRSLLTGEAKAMASHLGVSAPEKAPECLNCHATNAPEKQRGERFALSDGVGCESCHGAAERWIQAHVEKDTNHQRNIAEGLRDIVQPEQRVSLCISCHAPTRENGFTHRLYGAGHPRIEFEIDSYESVMPRHWRKDSDYVKRKSPATPAQSWLIGQTLLAENLLNRQRSVEKKADFSIYQCYSCHHDFEKKEYLWKNYHGTPGEPPVNEVALQIVATALGKSNDEVKRDLKAIRQELNDASISRNRAEEMIISLLRSLTRPEYFSFQYCEQAIMGISVLLTELREIGCNIDLKKEEQLLYAQVSSASRADPTIVRKIAETALKKVPHCTK